MPVGPVLLAANHPNSLLDPILVLATAGRPARPLAKAPLFRRPVVGRLIRVLGGIPVFRREDDPRQMARNEDTFRAAIEALEAGDAIQIFPEGRSHSDPSLSRLRTGAARIALAAEAASGWTLGVAIVPVGLTYVRKAFFRGRVVALYGAPIHAAHWRAAFAMDERDAARSLTDTLAERLRALTLQLATTEDADLIDVAERIWSLEKGLRTPRGRVELADRLPRLQAFARGLAWLRAHDPDLHTRLARRTGRYRRKTRLLGAGEGEVPDRYAFRPSAHWVLVRGLPLVLLAPFALVAVAIWWIPYRLVGAVVRRMELPTDVVATYKLAASIVAYPLFLALWTVVIWAVLGGPAAAAALLVLPGLGLLGVSWLDRAREVGQDLRLFSRLTARGERGRRLAEERRGLVAEFDALREMIGEAALAGEGAKAEDLSGWPPSR